MLLVSSTGHAVHLSNAKKMQIKIKSTLGTKKNLLIYLLQNKLQSFLHL